jgi:hypothetical protein
MLTATDTLIEYLASELSPLQVFWWRKGDVDTHSGYLKQDALNVTLLGFWEAGSEERCLVSLDLLAKDDRTALTSLKEVRDVLLKEQTIPERDYTDPNNPTLTGRNVSWEGREIRFISVRTPSGARYAHYNATFPLIHTRE